MVYKGAKHIRYLNIGTAIGNYLGTGPVVTTTGGSAGSTASQNKAALMAKTRNAIAASSVAAQAASLTNQSGGNIGFTYE